MKYDIKFSCGHKETVQLYGKNADKEKRIHYYERYGLCSKCWREQKEIEKSIGCDEVEMSYRDYKTKYAACNTKRGSYNGETKTIIVYVPHEQKREII